MSENCHPGIEYLLQLYAEEQSRVDTALTQKVQNQYPINCGRIGW